MYARPLVIAASVLFSSLAASSAPASFTQQGAKLIGTGVVGVASQGYSVAVSADGNTAVIGGYQDNGGAGATWVFFDAVSVPLLTMWGILAIGMSIAGAALAMGLLCRRGFA